MVGALGRTLRRPSHSSSAAPASFIGYAALSTAGVVLLGNADAHAIVWFAPVVLAAWCVVSGGVVVGIAYWLGIVLLFEVGMAVGHP